jgi:hypothetical protein
MLAEISGNPVDAEALDVAVATHDLDAGGGKPHIGEIGVFEIGVFEADVRLNDLAVIAWDSLPQVIDIDVGQLLDKLAVAQNAVGALLEANCTGIAINSAPRRPSAQVPRCPAIA